jgi:hypothetical protein
MKIDQIIDSAKHIQDKSDSELSIGYMRSLACLIEELAHHVKAQEPEPIDDYNDEVGRLIATGYRTANEDEPPVDGDFIDSKGVLWKQPPVIVKEEFKYDTSLTPEQNLERLESLHGSKV